jgi:ribonuclease D
MPAPKTPPAKDAIAELEPFAGLAMDRISVIGTVTEAELAMAALHDARFVGFDTESKPTFNKGQRSTGPHVLQFATLERAYIFLAIHTETHAVIRSLLESPELVKIGFGLDGDLRQIAGRFGVRPAAVVDLGRTFRKLGYRNTVGAKTAVAILFERKLLKSKAVTTSNWAAGELTERQLCYAANDAYAAIRSYHALEALLPSQPLAKPGNTVVLAGNRAGQATRSKTSTEDRH